MERQDSEANQARYAWALFELDEYQRALQFVAAGMRDGVAEG
jgi:hypothetical protein